MASSPGPFNERAVVLEMALYVSFSPVYKYWTLRWAPRASLMLGEGRAPHAIRRRI